MDNWNAKEEQITLDSARRAWANTMADVGMADVEQSDYPYVRTCYEKESGMYCEIKIIPPQ